MSFEVINKNKHLNGERFSHGRRGDQVTISWDKNHRAVLRLNKLACEKYNIDNFSHVIVSVDRERTLVGFELTNDPVPGAYKLGKTKSAHSMQASMGFTHPLNELGIELTQAGSPYYAPIIRRENGNFLVIDLSDLN